MLVRIVFFLCKQKTAYEMRISDWSSDVCSSDLMLEPLLNGCGANTPGDTTEENIQARSRGITLMAISNRLGYMVLSTGNKRSEERRVGKECVSTCRSRWSTYTSKKKQKINDEVTHISTTTSKTVNKKRAK